MSPEGSNFAFKRLVVRRALYEYLTRAPHAEEESRPTAIEIGLQVGSTVRLNPSVRQGAITIDIKVLPDQRWQPYRVEVHLTAVFAAVNEGAMEQMDEFCRMGGPNIVFPYIREIVHRLTMDAPDGPIRLDPINFSAMVNEGPWQVLDEPKSSSEPPQPSGQSPSA